MNRQIEGAGAAVWGLGVLFLLVLLLLALALPSHVFGSNLYGSVSLRQRAERVGEWQGAIGGEYTRGPWSASGEVQHEREANPPGQGSTIYTDLETRAAYNGPKLGAGIRWARIEEHDMEFAETFAELKRQFRFGTLGIGLQQRYEVDFSDPEMAARVSYGHSWTWWRIEPSVRANAANGAGAWTTEARQEIAVPLSEHWSVVQMGVWERRSGKTRAQAKATLRVEW